jgi:hypothetical protein
METAVKYQHGKHPNSLANLTPGSGGRPKTYSEDKKNRQLTVTKTGWDGAKELAAMLNCDGISDLIEKLGRGELKISQDEQL